MCKALNKITLLIKGIKDYIHNQTGVIIQFKGFTSDTDEIRLN